MIVTIYQEGCGSIIGGRSAFAAGLADIGNFLLQIYRFDADTFIVVIIPGGFDYRVIFLLIGIQISRCGPDHLRQAVLEVIYIDNLLGINSGGYFTGQR